MYALMLRMVVKKENSTLEGTELLIEFLPKNNLKRLPLSEYHRDDLKLFIAEDPTHENTVELSRN